MLHNVSHSLVLQACAVQLFLCLFAVDDDLLCVLMFVVLVCVLVVTGVLGGSEGDV